MFVVNQIFRFEVLKKNFGFSIIEIAVSMGALSLFALGSAGMIASAVKTQKSAESSSEVIQAKKEFQTALRGWKRNPDSGTIPIALGAGNETSSCFNESAALSSSGLDIRVTIGSQILKKGSTYNVGNMKFKVMNVLFADAVKVYDTGTEKTYFGMIKMSSKNLATGVESPEKVMTSTLLTIASGSGSCGTLSSVAEFVSVQNSAINCGIMNEYDYSTGGSTDRCTGSAKELVNSAPVGSVTSCLDSNGGGFPVFKNSSSGATSVHCIKPVQSVCMENSAVSGENHRKVLRGFGLINSATGNGEKVASISCEDIGTPSELTSYGTPTTVTSYHPSTQTQSYESLAKANCERLVESGKVDPTLFDCDSMGSSSVTVELLAPDTTLVSAPTTSQTKPTNFSNIACQCGATAVSHGAYCGYYFDGLQGFNIDIVASAVFRCNDGSLDIVFSSGTTPASINKPSDESLRTGIVKPASPGYTSGGSSYMTGGTSGYTLYQ